MTDEPRKITLADLDLGASDTANGGGRTYDEADEETASRRMGGAGVTWPVSAPSVPVSLSNSACASRGDAIRRRCASESGKSLRRGVLYSDGVENPEEGSFGDHTVSTAVGG